MTNLEKTEIPVLPEEVPVEMPDLPASLNISTLEQYRAISDRTRTRILNIIQLTPATAKQIAGRLGASPGAIGHHLRVLEEAGLVQLSARRQVRGMIANYYTRTARIFNYHLPEELAGADVPFVDILLRAREELVETVKENPTAAKLHGFPHARLSAERAEYYEQRIQDLMDDLLREPAGGTGDVYGILLSMFRSPAYLQKDAATQPESE